ncbi:hypothetical protein TNCV_2629131 [Trichonephila clavipes]|uniref:Uncharacterized protein n=1 Tax=Trichonephila clavipes TaxID=2585209 RepID=A0A8X6VF14_TRICX|nr:hypothetical protein TNCV_2629131 [Trichonephila clavipes]
MRYPPRVRPWAPVSPYFNAALSNTRASGNFQAGTQLIQIPHHDNGRNLIPDKFNVHLSLLGESFPVPGLKSLTQHIERPS